MIHWSEIWTSDKTYVMLLPLKSKSLDQDQCNTKSQKKKKKKKKIELDRIVDKIKYP